MPAFRFRSQRAVPMQQIDNGTCSLTWGPRYIAFCVLPLVPGAWAAHGVYPPPAQGFVLSTARIWLQLLLLTLT
jgi:hypothetical protein